MGAYSITKGKQERRERAEEIINTLIDLNMPHEQTIRKQYGDKLTFMAKQQFNSFINKINNIGSNDDEPLKPVQTIDISQTELGRAIISAGELESIQNAKNALIQQKMPTARDMFDIYGQYAEYAKKQFELFNYFGKTRNCDLPFNIHPLRGSGVIKILKYDEQSKKPSNYYVTLMSFHDSVEDLAHLMYSLNNIDKFYEEFIPKEFHEPLALLTNETGIIYNYFKSEGTDIKNNKDLEKNLTNINKKLANGTMKQAINQMLENMPPPQDVTDFNKYSDYAKLWHYENVYLENLIANTINTTEYVVLELKEVGDLADNLTSLQARPLEGQRKTLHKAIILNSKSNRIINTLEQSNYRDIFESRNKDILYFTNYRVKEIAINYLEKDFHKQEHLISGLKTLTESTRALYQNIRKQPKIIMPNYSLK